MKDKKILNRRQWLRPASNWGPHSSIHTTVRVETYDKISTIQGEIGIRDCSNFVSLDIYASNDKHYTKQLAAIDKLINELDRFRTAFKEGRKEITKRGGWKCT